MKETWLANGVELGWLLDVGDETAYVYRQGAEEPGIVEGFEDKTLSGGEVLPGFVLELGRFLPKGKRK